MKSEDVHRDLYEGLARNAAPEGQKAVPGSTSSQSGVTEVFSADIVNSVVFRVHGS